MNRKIAHLLWNAWCLTSIVGIWPRFIEPRLLSTTRLRLPISGLTAPITLVQLSDLHLHQSVPNHFLKRLIRKVRLLQPDAVVLTGDYIRHASLDNPTRLRHLLSAIREVAVTYAVLGNHDYSSYVQVNEQGEYGLAQGRSGDIVAGFRRLVSPMQAKGVFLPNLDGVKPHADLTACLQDAGINLLHNQTQTLAVDAQHINITGVGEYMAGQCDVDLAFRDFDNTFPGVVLAHNPDALSLLRNSAAEVILCGHTHGGAVNIPGVWQRITVMENRDYVRGLHTVAGKQIYVSRGIGGSICFRWFCPPEIVHLTLEPKTS